MSTSIFVCPVCDGECGLFDVVDFNKACEASPPLSGQPVYYARCDACGFCYAPQMCAWTIEEFAQRVYNADYVKFDLEYEAIRPRQNADCLISMFGNRLLGKRHLDYGGGNGQLVRLLTAQGWDSTSYDPFTNANLQIESLGKFDLITAYEVFEHVPDVNRLLIDLRALLIEGGGILFSTLVSDGNIEKGQRLSWWYAAPRNGHISLHSSKSLSILGRKHGFGFYSFNTSLHFFN